MEDHAIDLRPIEVYEDFYASLRARLRRQVSAWQTHYHGRASCSAMVDHLLFLPDLFHLAVRLVFDRAVPAARKGALVAGIAYVLSPIDLIPDTIPIAGWFDDLIVLTLALHNFLDTNDPLMKAAIERHWVGDRDLLDVTRHILDVGEAAIEFLPNQFVKLLKPIFKDMLRSG